MIGWSGLIGQLVQYILSKISGKEVDMTAENRRRASRTFLGFYQTLSDLESVVQDTLFVLEKWGEIGEPRARKEWLADLGFAIDETSQRFLESTLGIQEVLEIFDPVLAHTVSDIEAHKGSFLLLASDGFKIPPNSPGDEAIYTVPNVGGQSPDLEERYTWYQEHYPLDFAKSVEWPAWVTFGYIQDIESEVSKETLFINDQTSREHLVQLLKSHQVTLAKARTGLGYFIRRHFTVDDLLAVREPVKTLDPLRRMHRTSEIAAAPYTRFFSGRPIRRKFWEDDKEG